MPRDPRYDVLFEPLAVGPKTLPNRFWQVPHCIGATSAWPGMNAALRGIKAEGGWGAVNTELVSISPEVDPWPHPQPTIWDDNDVHNLSLISGAIHMHGALAGIELGYNGFSRNLGTRMVARNPSQVADETIEGLLGYSIEASVKDISELKGLWVQAAVRSRDAGFDVVYVTGSNELGTGRWLSPFFNKRTDGYGGSLENRARFWLETLEEVRSAVGSDCAVATRLALDDLRGPAGVTLKDMLRVLEWMDPLVDLFDVNLGGWDWGEDMTSSRFYSENSARQWTTEARAVVTKPVVSVGRLTSPEVMVSAIKNGQLDIIGAARPSIADPFLPNKINEGRLDDVRECIGCNACIGRWETRSRIVCTQNATMGEEFRRGWHPERFPIATNADNDVVVIGAGPAGLECAMVLGKRGMRRVHLVDAAPEIGGVLRWIPRLPRLGQWGRLLNYRQIQLAKLRNVEVITKTRLDSAAAMDYGAEFIVIATGAAFATNGTNYVDHAPIPGADASQQHCLTPEQIMLEGKEAPGGTVAILDYDGYVTGIGLAELMRSRGHEVVYVTPFPHPASYTRYTGEVPNVQRLATQLGIRVLAEKLVSSISPGEITVSGLYDTSFRSFPDADGNIREQIKEPDTVEVDAVVLVTDRQSNTELYRGLIDREDEWPDAGVKGVYRIGDCVSPRQLSEAIFDGHRLAREIDSPDPAVPVPVRREIHLWGTTRDPDIDARAYLNGSATLTVAAP